MIVPSEVWAAIDSQQMTQEEECLSNELAEMEMAMEMETFLQENRTHQLMSENPWKTRSNERGLSRKSEIDVWMNVSTIGQDYITGDSDYGKIYIPHHIVHNVAVDDIVSMRVQFKGFGGARSATMPWRAVRMA